VLAYIGRRLVLLVVVVAGMSVITFSLTHLVPGNPARLLAGPHASLAEVQALAHRYGLDRPVVEQYVIYVQGLFRGDLGMSLTDRRPVLQDLAQFLPATIELTTAALVLTIAIGIPLGILSGVARGTILDHLARILSIGGVSIPIFWLGLILQLVLYRELGVLPPSGRLGPFDIPPPGVTGLYTIDALLAGRLDTLGTAFAHLALPAITVAAGSIAVVTRMMRASVIDALEADYVRTARSKGLPERTVVLRHVLKNALIPTVTVLGLQIGYLLAGNVLAEAVFSWPGIGLYAVNAIGNLDYAAIMGVTLVVSVVYVVVNLIVDVIYGLLDPRISYA
jgi:peptide/nickel transport system permease protein